MFWRVLFLFGKPHVLFVPLRSGFRSCFSCFLPLAALSLSLSLFLSLSLSGPLSPQWLRVPRRSSENLVSPASSRQVGPGDSPHELSGQAPPRVAELSRRRGERTGIETEPRLEAHRVGCGWREGSDVGRWDCYPSASCRVEGKCM